MVVYLPYRSHGPQLLTVAEYTAQIGDDIARQVKLAGQRTWP